MLTSTVSTFDIDAIRKDFPVLSEKVYGKPLIYLDNGATTQKPESVLQALETYYRSYNSNVHRGVHFLSQKATDAQEAARKTVADFIHAEEEDEIIFTRGTTESVNLLANTFGRAFLKEGDEVLVTEMEHHSNLVPWQMACEERGARVKAIPLQEDGQLQLDNLDSLLSEKVKIVAVTWVSNSLGTINPIREIVQKAHTRNIPVMVDAAQSVQHLKVDVQDLDIDFLAFSGHKIYGPTGIGVLYGKSKYLTALPPYQGGGSMIDRVTLSKTTYAAPPFRFEAGTPDISGAIGLGAALNYVSGIGIENIIHHEHQLMTYALEQLQTIEGLRIIGSATPKAGAVSFLVEGIHPFDLGELLDKQGVAVRTGHHCCQPIMDFYQIPGTVRASFALYNTMHDIDELIEGIRKAITMLR